MGIAGFVSLLCHQPVGICCHCHPPGAVSWQPFPAPHTSSVPVGSVCWECASFLGISFCSRQSFWAVSFRVWLQKSLKGRITMRFVKVLLSDPTWQPVLCVGGCCYLHCRELMSPSQFSPADPKGSYRNIHPLLPFVITESPPCHEAFLEFSWRKPHGRGSLQGSPELCLEQGVLRAASACAAPAWQHPRGTAWADGIRWSKIPSWKRFSPVQTRHGIEL